MIVEWFIAALLSLVTWFIDLLPSWSLPSWITGTGDGTIRGGADWAASNVGSLSNWIPLGTLSLVAAVVLVCIPIAIGIKVTRMVLSAFTGGGGGAG